MIKGVQQGKPFHLGGYSFGACVAIEMFLQLESRGEALGTLQLMDGSHAFVSAETAAHTSGSDEVTQVIALCSFALMFTSVDYREVQKHLTLSDGFYGLSRANLQVFFTEIHETGLSSCRDFSESIHPYLHMRIQNWIRWEQT